MGKKYAMGVDFGSLSARAVLFAIEDGAYTASFDAPYEHGILEERHPYTGKPLPPASALQIPGDYVKALRESVRGVLRTGGVKGEDIVAMSVDFTSCSLVTLDRDYRPLCEQERFRASRHTYVKMWKQHTAAEEAEEITRKAGERAERYGGRIFSEWGIPKILETLREEPEVYQAAHRFMEAGDWMIYLLTGEESMSPCSAGFKFMWTPEEGYPPGEFFAELDERMAGLGEKLIPEERILPLDACGGCISRAGSELTGLPEGIPVAPMRIDGHSSVAALGSLRPGEMTLIMGTSLGMVLVGSEDRPIPGVCGVCYGSLVPGLYGYESGISGCGDIFQWFERNLVPESYKEEAGKRGLSVLGYLSERLGSLKPGESGLLALDWWNGNRSLLEDDRLTGLILGLQLSTKPEEILRALFEALGFAARMIIEEHRKHGVPVERISAVGGIAEKNPYFVQILSDITGCEIHVPRVSQACALGSAIYAAVAAGKSRGGYDTLEEAVEKMGSKESVKYSPNGAYREVYQELYADYRELHDYFGRGRNNVMKRLLDLKKRTGN